MINVKIRTHERSMTLARSLVTVLLSTAIAISWPVGDAAAAEPIYPVMNTSEYPPDGIYFRNSPNWNDTSRITGLGVFAGDQVRLKCWEYGTNVARLDGGSNTVWYQADNVTRPSSPAGPNSGWLNAHFVNDGTGPNQVVPGVIRCGTASAPPSSAPTTPPPTTPPYTNPNRPQINAVAETDRLLWQSSMATFIKARSDNLYSWALDWSSDQCSVPLAEPMASQPRGYDFRNACFRHDFGYRNYKAQGRLTEPNRQRIDDNFQRDMYAACDTYTGWRAARGVECRRIADVYHFFVRRCGNQPMSTCAENVRRSFDFLR